MDLEGVAVGVFQPDLPGVDPLGVLRAAWLDLRSGSLSYGGSTLTMQLVRFLEPRRGRQGLAGKLVEAVLAARLERVLGKQQILEQYPNRAEHRVLVEVLPEIGKDLGFEVRIDRDAGSFVRVRLCGPGPAVEVDIVYEAVPDIEPPGIAVHFVPKRKPASARSSNDWEKMPCWSTSRL